MNSHSNTFTSLSNGLNLDVNSISALDPLNVYIGGDFTNGGTIGKYITRWDGTQFNRLGSADFNDAVSSVSALDQTHVYMTGSFTQYGSDTSMNQVAMWDGTNMTALGSGIPTLDIRTIYALDENHVYIGGNFDHIKMWNGRSYITLAGTGSLSILNVLSFGMLPNNKTTLYIGGGGTGSRGIQKWTT